MPGAAKILEYQPEISGDSPPAPVPDYLQDTLDDLKTTLEYGSNVQHKELTIARPNQESTYVEINTSLLSSRTGKIFGGHSRYPRHNPA